MPGANERGINLHSRQVRTALRRADLSGSFVVGKYSLSPYMACEHGCIYCDGRAERYFVEGEFDRDIVARENLPDLLERELPRLRERGFVSIGSGISDAYQPAEARTELMRRCAQVLARHRFPVVIMTKSALALRDLEIWSQVNAAARVVFLVSLTHATDETRKTWEPRASSVEERLEALEQFRKAGCATGVLAMPLLPGITDTEANLAGLYERVAKAGVDFIMPGGLTLRPGRQKDVFLRHLERHRPDLVPRYRDLYGEDRPSGAVRRAYTDELNPRLLLHNRATGLPWLVPHYVYRDHLNGYDAVNVLLHHMVELYRAHGVDTAPLAAALRRYLHWLTARKADYNRHRSWRYEDLDAEFVTMCRDASPDDTASGTSALARTIGNGRLAAFIARVVLERRVFDYVTCRLD